jgi:hypothetical protein
VLETSEISALPRAKLNAREKSRALLFAVERGRPKALSTGGKVEFAIFLCACLTQNFLSMEPHTIAKNGAQRPKSLTSRAQKNQIFTKTKLS